MNIEIPATQPGAVGRTILIIDDEPSMREMLQLTLEAQGYRVLAAGTGGAGLKLALRRQPDIIICDVNMPDMSGHQVLETLQCDYETRSIPFIFLTGCLGVESIRLGMAAGAAEYVAKPFEPEELREAIAACERRLTSFDQLAAPIGAVARCA